MVKNKSVERNHQNVSDTHGIVSVFTVYDLVQIDTSGHEFERAGKRIGYAAVKNQRQERHGQKKIQYVRIGRCTEYRFAAGKVFKHKPAAGPYFQ